VPLSETREELMQVAESHGWSLDRIHIQELGPPSEGLDPDQQLTIFHPSELELGETIKAVLAQVEQVKPSRVVFDSLSEMRLLAQDPLVYRRQILSLKQFFIGRQTTVMMLDDRTGPGEDLQLQSLAHGVIRLENVPTDFGSERRQLRVFKMRGKQYRGGLHDFNIQRGGIAVYPRLTSSEHFLVKSEGYISSDVKELDQLMGGGLPRGSSTLLLGPAGSGKSSLAIQFCQSAAKRGERVAIFLFDETVEILQRRCRGMGCSLEPFMESKLLSCQQIDAAEMSPGEFADLVQRAVSGRDVLTAPAKVILIDSLNGYLNSMSQEKQLTSHLHEVFTFLNDAGVTTLVTVAQSGMMGSMTTPVDTTYLADNVLLFRFFESFGLVRRAISMVKKRTGGHEQSIRELRLTPQGVFVGHVLDKFQGVLTGVPTFHGKSEELMNKEGQYDS
jgi:circadian clock protein KaiC